MRLPWQQLSMDGKRRAKSFGLLLGIGTHAGVGFVSDLWEAALDLAPDGDFSGAFSDPGVLVAHSGGNPSGCTAEPAGVVECLQRVGLVATTPTLRVRGLDRYRSAWLKNRKPKSTPAGSAVEPPRVPKRKTETKTETENSLTTLSTPSTPGPPVSMAIVFDHWKRVMGHPDAKLTKEREKALGARLKEGYSVEQLKRAVDGCSRTPHNMGQNENHKHYDDLELICRTGSNVERFANNAGGPKPQPRTRVVTLEEAQHLYDVEPRSAS